MNLPYKTLFIVDNAVVGYATIYVENATASGPIGSEAVDVEGDSPIVTGWTRTLDKGTGSYKWKEPKK